MTHRAISVHRVQLHADQLAALPEAERNLLFLAGHILNELNSLNKIFTWCLSRPPNEASSAVNSLAQGVQALVYARVLAGKVSEAWEALKVSWSRSKVALRLESSLHPDAVAALRLLKKYFGRSNPINRVRNSVAFHYSANTLGAHWQEAIAGAPYEAIFGGTIGNNLNVGAETVANAALLHSVGRDTPEESLRVFFEDVQGMAYQMTAFLEGVTLVLMEQALGKPLSAVATRDSVPVSHPCSQVIIPYFCEPAREDA